MALPCTVWNVNVHCSFQGLSADTLLKRDSAPTEGEGIATAKETVQQDLPEEASSEVLQETDSDVLAKLQENKQEFYNKIKELSDSLTELKEQGSEYLQTFKDNKQKLSDIITKIAASSSNFNQQNSELLHRLQDKIREVISQQDSADKINVTIPLEVNSESLAESKQIKQELDNKINQLKSEAQEKIQELRDKLQAEEQDGASKRDLSDALSGDSVISILLSVPTSLASSFQKKFSEFKEDADQVFENFVASLGGSLGVLENLRSVVNSSVLANVSNIGEIASAASGCFQAQEGAVESLIKQTGK
jgi:DNA repair exonuclease SbcCD ATPase subunit